MELKPFSPLEDISVGVDVAYADRSLILKYSWEDPKDLILFNKTKTNQRINNLWEETCFEFFIRDENATSYKEFNFSTTGAWNIFEFDDYRKNMRESNQFPNPVMLKKDNTLLCQVDGIDIKDTQIINLCAVLKHQDNYSYWASGHLSNKPDFHRF